MGSQEGPAPIASSRCFSAHPQLPAAGWFLPDPQALCCSGWQNGLYLASSLCHSLGALSFPCYSSLRRCLLSTYWVPGSGSIAVHKQIQHSPSGAYVLVVSTPFPGSGPVAELVMSHSWSHVSVAGISIWSYRVLAPQSLVPSSVCHLASTTSSLLCLC